MATPKKTPAKKSAAATASQPDSPTDASAPNDAVVEAALAPHVSDDAHALGEDGLTSSMMSDTDPTVRSIEPEPAPESGGEVMALPVAIADAKPARAPKTRQQKSAANRQKAQGQARWGRVVRENFHSRALGAVMLNSVELGDPVSRRMLERAFYPAADSLYWLEAFGGMLLKPDDRQRIETAIANGVTESSKELNTLREQTMVLVKEIEQEYQVEQLEMAHAQYLAAVKEDVPIFTPLCRRMLSLYAVADEVLRNLATVYIHGKRTRKDRDRAVVQVKGLLAQPARTALMLVGGARRRLREEQSGKKPVATPRTLATPAVPVPALTASTSATPPPVPQTDELAEAA